MHFKTYNKHLEAGIIRSLGCLIRLRALVPKKKPCFVAFWLVRTYAPNRTKQASFSSRKLPPSAGAENLVSNDDRFL
jgi:hypothetical protein